MPQSCHEVTRLRHIASRSLSTEYSHITYSSFATHPIGAFLFNGEHNHITSEGVGIWAFFFNVARFDL
jgi:hypothetical protein